MDNSKELILGPNGTIMPREQARQQKLIIPGGGRPSPSPGAPGQLIMPDQQTGVAGMIDIGDRYGAGVRQWGSVHILCSVCNAPSFLLLCSVTTPTPPSRYRPPPGFMNETINEDETVNLTADEMLNKLRSRAARWYTLAKYIPALYKQSYTASIIDETAGITPAEQSRMAVAGTVHESLKMSGQVPASVMAAFDNEGDQLLYPLRWEQDDGCVCPDDGGRVLR